MRYIPPQRARRRHGDGMQPTVLETGGSWLQQINPMFGEAARRSAAEALEEQRRTMTPTPLKQHPQPPPSVMLAGGAGTPCASPFQPSANPYRPCSNVPAAAAAPAGSKAVEAERKRSVEAAAARRCASGRVFPGTTYRLERTIGKGSYGRVKLATDLRTGQSVAIKFLAKDLMTKQAHWVRVRREINLLTLAHHPHVIGMHEWLEAGEDVLLVMEYVQGKDLFDRINDRPEKRYSEADARPILRQLVSALDYCHQNRIVHRDLKPENVMIDTAGRVKLIDFGFANMFHPRDHLTTNCGSPLYAAPEIVQARPYIGPEVDIWSLGIILYAMLVGALPFEDEQLKGLYKKIGDGRFTFPEHVSPAARDLIRSMLQVSVLDRATMQQIRLHPWVLGDERVPPESGVRARPSHIASPREELLRLMPEYGYNQAPDALRSTVVHQPDSPAFAGYCMLEEKERRERGARSPAIPIYAQHAPGLPVKMASSLKEYRSPLDAAWTDVDFATPRFAMDTSVPLSSIPVTPVKAPPGHHANGNIVTQAAASVVSKFRRFRDMKFGLASNGGAAASSSSRRGDIHHL